MRCVQLVCLAAVLGFGAGRARAQSVSEVLKLDGVEQVHRVFSTHTGPIDLVVRVKDQAAPVLITSKHPDRRVPLPGADPASLVFINASGPGSVVTWLAGGKAHRVASATGLALPPRPVPRGMTEVTPGASGGMVFVARNAAGEIARVKVLDRGGRTVAVNEKLLRGAHDLTFTHDNEVLVIDQGRPGAWHYSLKKRRRVEPFSNIDEKVQRVASTEVHTRTATIRADRTPGKLVLEADVKGAKQILWSIDHAGPFAEDDRIVFVQRAGTAWVINKAVFSGGQRTWVSQQVWDREWEIDHGKERDERLRLGAQRDAEARARKEAKARRDAEEDERIRAANRRATAAGRSSSSSSSSSPAEEDIEDAARRLLELAAKEGLRIETSQFGTSNQSNPIEMNLRLKGRFIVIAIVDPGAVKTQLWVTGPGAAVGLSYDTIKLDGWLINGQGFNTGGQELSVRIRGGGYSGNGYATGVMLFSY